MPSIVTVGVTLQKAPAPNKLQRTGAFISQGATVTTPGTLSLLTQYSDLTPIILGQLALSTASWLAGATFTGAITGNTLTASGTITGTIYVGGQVFGTGVPANTVVTAFGSGSGGAGTYTLNNSVGSPIGAEGMRQSGIVTATAAAVHGITIGTTETLTIIGCNPAGYNGTFLCTATTTTQFVYNVASNPGTFVSPGSYTPQDVSELNAMALTHFAQGDLVAPYVFEVGNAASDNGAIAFLQAWLALNPKTIYNFLVPESWDNNPNFLALLALYENPTAQQYFTITTTLSTYLSYTAQMKDAYLEVESIQTHPWPANVLTAISSAGGVVSATTTTAHGVAVGDWFQIAGCIPAGYNGWWQAISGTTGSTLMYNVPADPGTETTLGTLQASQAQSTGAPPDTEFSAAASFYDMLRYNPSGTNKVAPLAFQDQFGVTPFPSKGLQPLLQTLDDSNVNYVATGAEGGISDTIIWHGHLHDGNGFTFWYAIDWVAINAKEALANEVINGANNPVNPLFYNQDGINRLQQRVVQVMKSAIAFGLVVGTVAMTQMDGTTLGDALDSGQFAGQAVVNAIPFITYTTQNPGDYQAKTYNGLSVIFIPQNGFEHIMINLVATDIVTLQG